MARSNIATARAEARSSPLSILAVFSKLGLTSFGGPVAHLGYFRDEFVSRRRWMSDDAYADLVALCQFLPGPASSQVGFAIGLTRGGPLGGLAAWVGFTWPSALLMVLFAYGAAHFDGPFGVSVLHGLMVAAVAVVAQAVWGMAQTLCPDRERGTIALAAILLVVFLGGAAGQVAAITAGAAAGVALAAWTTAGTPREPEEADRRQPYPSPISRIMGSILLGLAATLLAALPVMRGTGLGGHGLALFDAFYRAGALVFGGGHVVLPLLHDSVVSPGWVNESAFISGYGAVQAVPGPLFTIAAYLGAVGGPEPNGLLGATIALVAVFLPGLLLVAGALPHWHSLRRFAWARSAMSGVNAAVVGILAAALYHPVWTSAILGEEDFALAAAAFVLLTLWKAPPWFVVLLTASGAALLAIQ